MQHPNPHEPGWELWLYRRRRRGDTLTAEENAHLDSLAPWYAMFEQMAEQHDEQDKLVRAEIAKFPHGYGWHKGPGGGLPFDWSDDELPQLRPHDWTQVHHVRFHRVTSRRTGAPRQPRPRGRVRRPAAKRRTSSSSSTSSADPGDPDEPAPARLRVRRPSGASAVFNATRCTVAAGVVTAVGSWGDLPGKRQYTWPARRVLEVKWLEVVA